MSSLLVVIVVVLACAVAVVIYLLCLFLTASRTFGNGSYETAKALEGEKKYKEACYEYAIAALNGARARRECRARIRQLWKEHGPFDYSDVIGTTVAAGDTLEGGDTAGHHMVMSVIDAEIKKDCQK